MDASHVYWAGSNDHHLKRVKLPAGGSAEDSTIMAGYPLGVVNGYVYLTDTSSLSRLATSAFPGGTPNSLATGLSVPAAWSIGAAVDSSGVYVVDDPDLVRVPLAGGSPKTLVAGVGSVSTVATDATAVYWVECQMASCSLRKIAK